MELKIGRNSLPEDIQLKMNSGNVFFSEGYSDYVEKSGGTMAYVYDNSFLLPVHICRKAGIRFATFPSEPLNLSASVITDYRTYLDDVCECLKKQGITWVTSAASALFEYYPKKSLRIPFGSHILDLTLSEEQLFALMHSKHRNCVRRAEKSGVEIRSGGIELLKDYVELDNATWLRNGRTSYGNKFFKDMVLSMNQNVVFYIAYKDEQPQAGACFYCNDSMSYYMYGCSADSPETGAANLLHWKAICDLKGKGVQKYSFVGCRINEDENSKYHTIQRFKERFGGELVQGYMFKAILNPIKYKLFSLLYQFKNKAPLVDAVDQELEKWPELNN